MFLEDDQSDTYQSAIFAVLRLHEIGGVRINPPRHVLQYPRYYSTRKNLMGECWWIFDFIR